MIKDELRKQLEKLDEKSLQKLKDSTENVKKILEEEEEEAREHETNSDSVFSYITHDIPGCPSFGTPVDLSFHPGADLMF